MTGLVRIFTYIISIIALAIPFNAYSGNRYMPSIELSGKWGHASKGSKRNIARFGTVIPVFQKMDNYMTFLSIITMADSNKHFEGNFGGGHRAYARKNLIIGGYGFFDVRQTQNKNKLYQVTIGLEALTSFFELRGNVYLPFGTEKHNLANRNIIDIDYNNTRQHTVVKGSQQQVFEKAMKGYDIEAGGTLPVLPRLSSFVAYYYFTADKIKKDTGVRFRVNYNIARWLDLEAETNYDDDKKLTSYFGGRLSWNFSKKQPKSNNSLRKKIMQLPVRDVDIKNDVGADEPVEVINVAVPHELGFIFKNEFLPNAEITINNHVKNPSGLSAKTLSKNARRNSSKITDIGLFSVKNGELKFYLVGDSIAKRKAPQGVIKDLDIKLHRIGKDIISRRSYSNKAFYQNVIVAKVDYGLMTGYDAVKEKWFSPREGINQFGLSQIQAAKAGLEAKKTVNAIVNEDSIPRYIVMTARNLLNRRSTSALNAVNNGLLNNDQNMGIGAPTTQDHTADLSIKRLIEAAYGNCEHRLSNVELAAIIVEIKAFIDAYYAGTDPGASNGGPTNVAPAPFHFGSEHPERKPRVLPGGIANNQGLMNDQQLRDFQKAEILKNIEVVFGTVDNMGNLTSRGSIAESRPMHASMRGKAYLATIFASLWQLDKQNQYYRNHTSDQRELYERRVASLRTHYMCERAYNMQGESDYNPSGAHIYGERHRSCDHGHGIRAVTYKNHAYPTNVPNEPHLADTVQSCVGEAENYSLNVILGQYNGSATDEDKSRANKALYYLDTAGAGIGTNNLPTYKSYENKLRTLANTGSVDGTDHISFVDGFDNSNQQIKRADAQAWVRFSDFFTTRLENEYRLPNGVALLTEDDKAMVRATYRDYMLHGDAYAYN